MPKIVDHEQWRREIVGVVKRIIIEGGFEAATMCSIAAAAGFAIGALKHYFPNKDSIAGATFESALVQMRAKMSIPDPSRDSLGELRDYVAVNM